MSDINKKVVKDFYSAFQRRNIPALLDCLTDDVHWFSVGPPEVIPTAGARYGRKQVEEYFDEVDSLEEVENFTPQEFIGEGEKVVAIGEMRFRIKPTGAVVKTAWVHIFTFRLGKISAFRSFCDSAAVVAALTGVQSHPFKAAATRTRSAGLM